MRIFLMTLVLLGFLIGCQQSNNSNNESTPQETTLATTPNGDCIKNGYGYNGNCKYNYDSHATYGFSNYPYQYNIQYNNSSYGSFCSCPVNSYPVYNSRWGLGCVKSQNIYAYTSYRVWGWSYKGHWTPASQRPQQVTNGCYYGVLQACDTTTHNSCGYGSICSSVGNSSVGLCQRYY